MRAELTIAPDFSTMTMITRAPMYKDDTTYPLDNSKYKTKSLDGQHICAMLRWDGDEILANTEDGINLRFSLSPDDKAHVVFEHSGVTCKQIYKREE